VGTLGDGIIERSSFRGTVESGGANRTGSTGGILGFMDNNPANTIKNNFSTGAIQTLAMGNSGLGGIVGHAAGAGTITNNYSTSSVSGNNSNANEGVGGIVGNSGTAGISNNAALNSSLTLTGTQTAHIGRVAGTGTGILNFNYALSTMPIGGFPVTNGELNNINGQCVLRNVFEDVSIWEDSGGLNWDFVNIWEWDAVNLRPKLRGQP
jgi:hypothetical protein